MYPPLPNCSVDARGTVTLPDGRTVDVRQQGYIEGDTNAFVEQGDAEFTWGAHYDNDRYGEELTDEEINEEIEHEGRTYFLHEYVWEFIKWD
jgi:hypothetical protein